MLSPEGKSDKTYDGGGETQKAEWIVTHAKVSEIWQIYLIDDDDKIWIKEKEGK